MSYNIKQLRKEAKELADNLELYNGLRVCKVCGNEPEEQVKKIEKLCQQQSSVKLKKIVKKIEGLKYNEPLDSEMRIVNMICRSAISIVKRELT